MLLLRASVFFLSFASIVYELLLGQALSAFFGNTVLRYSVSVGLYLLSMGVASFCCASFLLKRAYASLLLAELFLVLLGASSVIVLHYANVLLSPLLFFAVAHLLIVAIGFLSGLELPLLVELHPSGRSSEFLCINYIAAFCGTLCFALLFYKSFGLMATAFAVALLNSSIALLLAFFYRARLRDSSFAVLRFLHISLFALLSLALIYVGEIDAHYVSLYLGHS